MHSHRIQSPPSSSYLRRCVQVSRVSFQFDGLKCFTDCFRITLNVFNVQFTCVPQRHQHDHRGEGVDSQSDGHLLDSGSEPPPVLLCAELPLIPVHIRSSVVGVLDDVEELVGVVAATLELLGGDELGEDQDQEVDGQEDGAGDEGVLQGEQGVQGVGGRGRLFPGDGVIPPVTR